MPELPEVETIKNDLKRKILNKKIVRIVLKDKKQARAGITGAGFSVLKNNYITNINRAGKLLIFKLRNKNKYLLIHLKMTGQLIYIPHPNPLLRKERGYKGMIAGGHKLSDSTGVGGESPNKYTRLIFNFSDKSKLFFNDLRKFGYVKLVGLKELDKIIEGYGPEPMDKSFNFIYLKSVLKNRRTSIKAILLNQKLISGIGNIYADEILFRARVKPDRRVNSLSDKEITNIVKVVKLILEKAIKYRGTTFSDYVDSRGKRGNFSQFLQVYGRTGEKCFGCQGVVKKEKIAGRGTHYCERCQK